MNKELVISVGSDQTQIALLEDKQLVELHHEQHNSHYAVGDIVCGKVSKIMPGLNAAFVDVGDEKDGFGHYIDFGIQFNSVAKYLRLAMNGDANMATLRNFKIEAPLPKAGSLTDLMKVGQYVLVQIAKEPISTKGPKLTGDISLAGRYMVLEPFSNKVTISSKIKGAEERNRLRNLVQSIRPQNFGIIIRTMAEGKTVADLDADLRSLLNEWLQMTARLKTIHCPTRVHAEPGSASALLRDVLTDEFNTIYVDNEPLYGEIRDYLRSIAPDKVDIVRHYKMETPIFEQFGIQRDIRRAFGKIVTIRSGVYLYIEHTEAMHVIDVNSGNHIKAGTGQEDTTLQVNIESAKEIARQL
ncbi:MAG: ribonuclease E/G, partial [Bacteroidales bacterium]|nr:ribonuclease E/G [Bacteroidales bacterium]